MQSANLRELHDPTQRRRLDRSADGRVLAQRQIRPGSLLVLEVGLEGAPQTSFAQNDHMIQALAPNGPDQALDAGILPTSSPLHGTSLPNFRPDRATNSAARCPRERPLEAAELPFRPSGAVTPKLFGAFGFQKIELRERFGYMTLHPCRTRAEQDSLIGSVGLFGLRFTIFKIHIK